MKHYLQFSDLDAQEYAYLFERAALIKRKFKAFSKIMARVRSSRLWCFS